MVVQIKIRLEICQFCNNSRTNNKFFKNLSVLQLFKNLS